MRHYLITTPDCLYLFLPKGREAKLTYTSYIKLSRLFDKSGIVQFATSDKKLYDYMTQQLQV